MAEEIDLKKCNFRNFRSPDLDLDLGSGHTAYHRPPSTDQISSKSEKLFVDGHTYGLTDVPTDRNFRPPLMLLGGLGGIDLKRQTVTELLPVSCHTKHCFCQLHIQHIRLIVILSHRAHHGPIHHWTL